MILYIHYVWWKMYTTEMFTRGESLTSSPAALIKTIVQNLSYKLLVYCIPYVTKSKNFKSIHLTIKMVLMGYIILKMFKNDLSE
jgi:hypothetical protein